MQVLVSRPVVVTDTIGRDKSIKRNQTTITIDLQEKPELIYIIPIYHNSNLLWFRICIYRPPSTDLLFHTEVNLLQIVLFKNLNRHCVFLEEIESFLLLC